MSNFHPRFLVFAPGPVISAPQLARIKEFVSRAKSEGARVLCGGGPPAGLPPALARGHYFAPTVIGDVTPDMHVVQEEVFGPVVVAYKFRDEADAIALANHSPFGLAAAVWTSDVKRAHRVADQLGEHGVRIVTLLRLCFSYINAILYFGDNYLSFVLFFAAVGRAGGRAGGRDMVRAWV